MFKLIDKQIMEITEYHGGSVILITDAMEIDTGCVVRTIIYDDYRRATISSTFVPGIKIWKDENDNYILIPIHRKVQEKNDVRRSK